MKSFLEHNSKEKGERIWFPCFCHLTELCLPLKCCVSNKVFLLSTRVRIMFEHIVFSFIYLYMHMEHFIYLYIAHGTPEQMQQKLSRLCEDVHTINMHIGRLTEKCLTFVINRGGVFFLLNTDQSMHLEEHSRRAF